MGAWIEPQTRHDTKCLTHCEPVSFSGLDAFALAAKPSGMTAYQTASEVVLANTQRLQLHAMKLAKDATIRIPGNTGPGKAKSLALNLIFSPRPGQTRAECRSKLAV